MIEKSSTQNFKATLGYYVPSHLYLKEKSLRHYYNKTYMFLLFSLTGSHTLDHRVGYSTIFAVSCHGLGSLNNNILYFDYEITWKALILQCEDLKINV